jgi:hypothetical protein
MRQIWLLRGVRRLCLRRRSQRPHLEIIDASLHVDTEAICPDCLEWISPADFVRRNAFDLLEHEVCPPSFVRQHRP